MPLSQSSNASMISLAADHELASQFLPQQVLLQMLSPGYIDVGLTRSSVEGFRYRSGEIIVCRQGIEEWVRWREPMQIFRVDMPQACLDLVIDEGGGRRTVSATSDLRDARVSALVSALQAEHLQGYPSGSLFSDSIYTALAVAMLHQSEQVRHSSLSHGMTSRQVLRVEHFMRDNLDRDLSLIDLANLLHWSPGHFGQMFRRTTNMTPHRFLQDLRLQHARTLLAREGSRVIDVAVACGFKTPQHFATCFRARYGETPKQYQRSSGISHPASIDKN
jgi:AraC family transcriptional regulator